VCILIGFVFWTKILEFKKRPAVDLCDYQYEVDQLLKEVNYWNYLTKRSDVKGTLFDGLVRRLISSTTQEF